MIHHLAKTLLKDLTQAGAVIDQAGSLVDVNDAFKKIFYESAPGGERRPGKALLNILKGKDGLAAKHDAGPYGTVRAGKVVYRLSVYFIDDRSGQGGLRLLVATPIESADASGGQDEQASKSAREALSPVFSALVGQEKSFIQALQLAQRAAQTDLPVLILGESGTGKEVLARSIHQASHRSKKAFVDVNCAAIPDSLVESELFGYERGAFTGANPGGKTGFFEHAHKGSIFMDEIGDAAPQTQAKLLRVLDRGQFKRIGGNRNIAVDVRLISATNQELRHRIAEGRFRADLLYRINTITIELRPLRERIDDLPLLANHFLKAAERERKARLRFSKESLAMLKAYVWPGNVRELKGVVDYAATMTAGSVISPRAFPGFLRTDAATVAAGNATEPEADDTAPPNQPETELLQPVVEQVERAHIKRVLEKSRNRSEAIQRLGISRRTFYAKIKQYGLE